FITRLLTSKKHADTENGHEYAGHVGDANADPTRQPDCFTRADEHARDADADKFSTAFFIRDPAAFSLASDGDEHAGYEYARTNAINAAEYQSRADEHARHADATDFGHARR
ncbi:MAG: hypothetical protein M3362_21165, partial [Acidobacteriota bacterium]|nr:hypothetical protein [Acidobacteriota bacterium]